MRKSAALFISSLTFLLPCGTSFADASGDPSDYADTDFQDSSLYQVKPQEESPSPASIEIKQTPKASIQSFTGKITKNKVRLRSQPSTDGAIVKELNKGDMLIVLDETDDFYAVLPPADTKAYVYRTYILDNVVEGSRINVRLDPDVEAPVIAQLNGGDRVIGTISQQNTKWLEITPPATTRFYIAKDFVEKIGDATVMGKIEKKRAEVNALMETTAQLSQSEMQKNFPEINLDGIYSNYNKVITIYSDFPEQGAKAKESMAKLQDEYLKKKIAYLEAKAGNSSEVHEQIKTQQQKLVQLEQQLKKERENKSYNPVAASAPRTNTNGISDKMAVWVPVEQAVYEAWAKENDGASEDEFYTQQSQKAFAIKGMIEPYTRVVKNKPGDYVIVNQSTHLPVAFIYSTQVNLQDYVGQEITVYGSPRANNNFAYPAYFVLGVE